MKQMTKNQMFCSEQYSEQLLKTQFINANHYLNMEHSSYITRISSVDLMVGTIANFVIIGAIESVKQVNQWDFLSKLVHSGHVHNYVVSVNGVLPSVWIHILSTVIQRCIQKFFKGGRGAHFSVRLQTPHKYWKTFFISREASE